MTFTSNFEPFAESCPVLAKQGKNAEQSFRLGADLHATVIMQLGKLADLALREMGFRPRHANEAFREFVNRLEADRKVG